MSKAKLYIAALSFTLALGTMASAQQGGSQMSGMQGHHMGKMDMTAMNQYANASAAAGRCSDERRHAEHDAAV